MGKRELVLIVVFILLGTALYQVTAPASPDGSGFSLRSMVDHVRREMGPRHEYLGAENDETIPIGKEIAEVRIARVARLQVHGTKDPHARLRWNVYSTGLDEQEARALAGRVALRQQRSGDVLSLEFNYPPEGRQRTELTLEVPARMRVRVARVRGGLEVRDIAGVELDETAGEVTLEAIAGFVRGSQTGGVLSVEKAADVDLTARRCEVTLEQIAGAARLDLSGGTLVARDVRGAVDLDANRVVLEFEGIGGVLNADLTQGSLEVSGVTQQARIDARGTEIRLELAKAVAVSAVTTDENVELRLPEGAGVTFEVTVEDGAIRLPDGGPEVNTLDQARRASGPYRGGGPTLALRTSHADIIVR